MHTTYIYFVPIHPISKGIIRHRQQTISNPKAKNLFFYLFNTWQCPTKRIEPENLRLRLHKKKKKRKSKKVGQRQPGWAADQSGSQMNLLSWFLFHNDALSTAELPISSLSPRRPGCRSPQQPKEQQKLFPLLYWFSSAQDPTPGGLRVNRIWERASFTTSFGRRAVA